MSEGEGLRAYRERLRKMTPKQFRAEQARIRAAVREAVAQAEADAARDRKMEGDK